MQPEPQEKTQDSQPGLLHPVVMPRLTFDEHKEATAADCEAVSKMLTELAKTIRKGNTTAFEKWWIEGGTEEGDAKFNEIRERIVLRYLSRNERVA